MVPLWLLKTESLSCLTHSKAAGSAGWVQSWPGPWQRCGPANWPQRHPNAWQPTPLLGGLLDGPVPSLGHLHSLVRATAVSLDLSYFSHYGNKNLFCLSTVLTIKSGSHIEGWKWRFRETFVFPLPEWCQMAELCWKWRGKSGATIKARTEVASQRKRHTGQFNPPSCWWGWRCLLSKLSCYIKLCCECEWFICLGCGAECLSSNPILTTSSLCKLSQVILTGPGVRDLIFEVGILVVSHSFLMG